MSTTTEESAESLTYLLFALSLRCSRRRYRRHSIDRILAIEQLFRDHLLSSLSRRPSLRICFFAASVFHRKVFPASWGFAVPRAVSVPISRTSWLRIFDLQWRYSSLTQPGHFSLHEVVEGVEGVKGCGYHDPLASRSSPGESVGPSNISNIEDYRSRFLYYSIGCC